MRMPNDNSSELLDNGLMGNQQVIVLVLKDRRDWAKPH